MPPVKLLIKRGVLCCLACIAQFVLALCFCHQTESCATFIERMSSNGSREVTTLLNSSRMTSRGQEKLWQQLDNTEDIVKVTSRENITSKLHNDVTSELNDNATITLYAALTIISQTERKYTSRVDKSDIYNTTFRTPSESDVIDVSYVNMTSPMYSPPSLNANDSATTLKHVTNTSRESSPHASRDTKRPINEPSQHTSRDTKQPINQPSRHASRDTNRPMNVLMIIADDLRPELGVFHEPGRPGTSFPGMRTPWLDRLGSESLVLRRAYVQQAICAPSRVSLLTSRRPDTTKVYTIPKTYWRELRGTFAYIPKCNNDTHGDNSPSSKAPPVAPGNFTTLPQFFKNRGYRTIGIGKIFHHGAGSDKDDPPSWTHYHHAPRNCRTRWYSRSAAWRAVYPEDMDPSCPLPDDYVASKAVEQLRSLGTADGEILKGVEPFFMAVGFYKPHLPFVVPAKYFDLYPIENIDVPLNVKRHGVPDIARNVWEINKYPDIAALNVGGGPNASLPVNVTVALRRAYYAAVSYVDDLVGQVLGELKSQGLERNTIVAFLGDHGWHLGEQNLWGKHTNFEEATRAPLMIKIPGITCKGSEVHAVKGTPGKFNGVLDCGLSQRDRFFVNSVSLRGLRNKTFQRMSPDVYANGFNPKAGISSRSFKRRLNKRALCQETHEKKRSESRVMDSKFGPEVSLSDYIRRGIVHDEPVEFVDLFPTLVEAAGFEPLPVCPEDSRRVALCTEGASLMGLLDRNVLRHGRQVKRQSHQPVSLLAGQQIKRSGEQSLYKMLSPSKSFSAMESLQGLGIYPYDKHQLPIHFSYLLYTKDLQQEAGVQAYKIPTKGEIIAEVNYTIGRVSDRETGVKFHPRRNRYSQRNHKDQQQKQLPQQHKSRHTHHNSISTSRKPLRNIAFSQYPRRGFSVMGYSVRTARYRYTEWIRLHRRSLPDPKARRRHVLAVELYDHSADPIETFNVAGRADYAEPERLLRGLLPGAWGRAGCEGLMGQEVRLVSARGQRRRTGDIWV